MTAKKLTGKISADRIFMQDIPRPPREIIDGFLALTDLAGTVSDAMDELGIAGAIPAATLNPMLPGARMVGPALTIRNIMQSTPPTLGAMERKSKQADLEAHNLAQPGDVVVIEGIAGISSLGGNSSNLGKRQGEAGAIVDGGTRDVATARRIGYPVWARGVSLITGKWRLETVAINGPVQIAKVTEGFNHLVTSIVAPVASGWSGCRVGFSPTGKRRLFTAHTRCRPSLYPNADDQRSAAAERAR